MFAVDPVHLGIGLGPVSLYLIALGRVHLAGRPFMVTGARDAAALALAVSGLVVAGPMELLMPEIGAAYFGAWIWLLLLAPYALSVGLLVMLLRPRLVIYNMSLEQIRPMLGDVASRLDPDCRWAGDCVSLPRLEVQLHVDSCPAMKNVQLVALGGRQSLTGWRRLEQTLRPELSQLRTRRNPHGIALAACGVAMLIAIGYSLLEGRTEVAQSLRDFLRL